jgi:hypothetical protein
MTRSRLQADCVERFVDDLRKPGAVGLIDLAVRPHYVREPPVCRVTPQSLEVVLQRLPVDGNDPSWPSQLGDEQGAPAVEDAEFEDVPRLKLLDQVGMALE